MDYVKSNNVVPSFPVTDQYLILQGEQAVGVLVPAPGQSEPLRASLTAGGYDTRDLHEIRDVTAECHVDAPRPCEISVSIGWARDLAREAGVPATELETLMRDGYRDETEVREALEATRNRLNGAQRNEADQVISFLWPVAGTAATQGL